MDGYLKYFGDLAEILITEAGQAARTAVLCHVGGDRGKFVHNLKLAIDYCDAWRSVIGDKALETYVEKQHHTHEDHDEMEKDGEKDGDEISWIIKNIENELAAVKKYYAHWKETEDAVYRQLAKDEARHAEQLIKQAQAIAGPDEKAKLQELTARYAALIKELA